MSKIAPHTTDLTHQLSSQICDVLVHLSKNNILTDYDNFGAIQNSESSKLKQCLNSEPVNNEVSLLLIGDDKLTEQLSKLIESSFKNRNIDIKLTIIALMPAVFLKHPFKKRYDLGCFIASPSHNYINNAINEVTNYDESDYKAKSCDTNGELVNEEHNDKNVQEANSTRFIKIAQKLRDLFADQSLLFIPNHLKGKSLNSLGYSQLKLDVSIKEIFSCWQFNLYNYKRRPDWLNAKYWANPENFDKYRW